MTASLSCLPAGRVTSQVQLVPWLEAHGEALFKQACELDLEGTVGKDLSAPYKRGVQPTWVKVKNPNYSRQEALGFRTRP